MSAASGLAFGTLLRQLRKRAGMTQRDLAAALGYSDSLISGLETGQRQPDPDAILPLFAPALGLQDDPSAAQRLYEWAAAIRGARPPLPAPPISPTSTPRNGSRMGAPLRLPALPVELIGRADEINRLGNRLLGHGGRLLTLVGAPGVGKTTLALAVGERIQHLYDDGACFVALAAVSDRGLMAAAILAQIAPGIATSAPPEKLLVEVLRRKHLLLVLDNLEQIPDAAPLVAAVLAECPRVTILATSRERLHLRAEQRFQVSTLNASDAVELFVQRAQAVKADFALSPEDSAAIQQLCQRLSYLPLAIELSAAWIHVLSCAEIIGEIERNFRFLTTAWRDVPERHRSLYAVYDHSWQLLTPLEQTAFARLSVFRERFSQEASSFVADIPLQVLSSLIDKSLLYRTATGEFEMHECSRQFAAEKLEESGESSAIQKRHERYFEVQSQKILQQLRPSILPLEKETYSTDLPNEPESSSSAKLRNAVGIRILMLSWEYTPYVIGGSGKHVSDLVPALSREMPANGAVQIELLAPRFAGGHSIEQINPGLTVYRVGIPSDLRYPFADRIPDQTRIAEQVEEVVKNTKYDLIHIQDWRFAEIAIALKQRQGIPLVATYHLLERMRYQGTPPGTIIEVENLERQIAQEAEHLIVCSEYMRREIQNHFGITQEKISVIPNGVKWKASEHFSSEVQSAIYRRYAPLGEHLLFFIGSALMEKGLSVLIRAMPRILTNHPNTRLVVAGKDCDRLLPLAYELSVEKAIDFVGRVSDQERDCLYRTVDALIIPSLYEPFGIVALEAMAFGCNVIASDVGGLGEVVRNLDNGLTIRPNDPQSIAEAVDLLFADPIAARQQRARALEDIRTFYQWPQIAAQTAQIYQQLIPARFR